MPFIFAVEVKYAQGKYLLDDLGNLMSDYPFLEGKVITGKILSAYKDNRATRIDKEFRAKVMKPEAKYVAELFEPNPVRTLGLPLPLNLLVVLFKYEDPGKGGELELPIAEGLLLRGSYTSYFEDEIKRTIKEHESGLLLEGTTFDATLLDSVKIAKESLTAFEQENYAHTKTVCRKIVEQIRQLIDGWKRIDDSESLAEKVKGFTGSLYSFASVGGPHSGVVTREETELILKCTMSLLFYVNFLLKNQRVMTPERT